MKLNKGWGFRIMIALFSGFGGLCIAVPFIFIYKADPWMLLSKNFLFGLIIGSSCTAVFELIYCNLRVHTFWVFLAVAATIAIGTLIAVYITNLTDLWAIIILLGCIETGGLTFTFFMCRYKTKLNEKLVQTQEKFKKMNE